MSCTNVVITRCESEISVWDIAGGYKRLCRKEDQSNLRIEILEMTIMPDHVYMVVIIPPKLAVSEVMGILEGKTAIAVFQQPKGLRTKPYWGNHFWSRGYCVTTVGMDEEKIRRYVKYQEDAERRDGDHELRDCTGQCPISKMCHHQRIGGTIGHQPGIHSALFS
jgi:putative transposase